MATLSFQPTSPVEWRSTLGLNVFRTACAAIVGASLAVIFGGAPWTAISSMPLIAGVGYWMWVPIYRFAVRLLTVFLPGDSVDGLAIRFFNGMLGLAFA